MKDTIYREDAIDAIRASTKKYTGFMEMEQYTDDDAVEAIEALPFAPAYDYSDGYADGYKQGQKDAQTEIIHCGECKYYHDSDGCFFSTATTGADGFCHWAERKEGEANEAD